MTSISLPRKVFQGVAKRADMFRMFDRHIERPDRFDGDQSATYAGEWFEIDETSYSASRHESGESVRLLRTYPELRLV